MEMYKYTKVEMQKYTKVEIQKYTKVEIYKYTKVEMQKYTNIQIYKYTLKNEWQLKGDWNYLFGILLVFLWPITLTDD